MKRTWRWQGRKARLSGLSDRLWTASGRASFAWRVDLPEDSNDRGMFLPASGRRQRRLIHYIAAGGMRQTRARHGQHACEEQRESVVRLFVAFVLLWLIFRFVTCA